MIRVEGGRNDDSIVHLQPLAYLGDDHFGVLHGGDEDAPLEILPSIPREKQGIREKTFRASKCLCPRKNEGRIEKPNPYKPTA